MPSIFGNSHKEVTSVKYFEIRLDDSNIIFRGSRSEAPSALLKGSLVLCLSEPLAIKGIRLRFTGEKRIAWSQPTSSGNTYVKHDEEFARKTWDFKRSGETLPAGNYEWPFDMVIAGSTPESLEGLSDSWVIYRMKATIERGVLQQNFVARKQVRIIRSLDPTALELAHTMAVENTWPEKLEYSLSTPMKAVIFGSNICVNFKLIPLLKGLKIGQITTELVEKQELHIRGPKVMTRSRQVIRKIHRDDYRLPEGVDAEDLDGQEGYEFTRHIPVPQSLRKCVQTTDVLGIKIRHSLTFNVQLNNPDGHVSELHATLPVFIFLSPNLPIDDNHNLIDHGGRGAIAANGLNDLTPPQYGEHQFDMLYSEIDPSGYATPGGTVSGFNTPMGARSRSVSGDNLIMAEAMRSTAIPINALQSRLDSLNRPGVPTARPQGDRSQLSISLDSNGASADSGVPENGHQIPLQPLSEPSDETTGPPDEDSNGQASGEELSRSGSEGDAEDPTVSQEPRHIEFSVEDLIKVPSYSTALRSNPRTPISEGLPSYHTATLHSSPFLPTNTCGQAERQLSARGSI